MFQLAPHQLTSLPLHNPRRRQRSPAPPDSLPRRKKQRAVASDDNAQAPGSPDQSAHPIGPSGLNGLASLRLRHGSRGVGDGSGRQSRVASGRLGKADGSITLTKTEKYNVSKLPAYPEKLKRENQVTINGSILPSSSYAVVFTPTKALVWAYNVNTSVPETFEIQLPRSKEYQHQSPPLGCLVNALTSGDEPGIVVVQPATGKVVYWESILTASAPVIVSARPSLHEGAVSLLSGEVVTGVQAIDPAGFVIVLSTGRLAHLSLIDKHGQPSISIQIIRGAAEQGSGSGFGSWLHSFASKTFKREVAAVSSASSTERGQRQVIVATSKGDLQLWSFVRDRQASLILEVDAKDELIEASRPKSSGALEWTEYDFSVLDVAHLPEDEESKDMILTPALAMPRSARVLVLVLNQTSLSFVYHLLELRIGKGRPEVLSSQTIKRYDSPVHHRHFGLPRLLLPSPGQTAFIVFSQSVVILARNTMSNAPPDSQQLLEEATATKPHRSPYEDVLDFRQDKSIQVVSASYEEASRSSVSFSALQPSGEKPSHNPACVLLVEGVGLIRLTANAHKEDSRKHTTVSARRKMEQAVFADLTAEDTLDLNRRIPTQFKPELIDAASKDISRSIINGTSPYIAHTEDSLGSRIRPMRKLLENIAAHYPNVATPTKCLVANDFSKLQSAQALAGIAVNDEQNLAGFVLEMLKLEPELDTEHLEAAGLPALPGFLLKNAAKMSLVAAAPLANLAYRNTVLKRKQLEEYMADLLAAINTLIVIYESALLVRTREATQFSLINLDGKDSRNHNDEKITFEFFTSADDNLAVAKDLIMLVAQFVTMTWEEAKGENATVLELNSLIPRLTEILCAIYTERIAYVRDRALDDRDEATNPIDLQRLIDEYGADRFELITSFDETANWAQGHLLGRQYRDCKALATLIIGQDQVLKAKVMYNEITFDEVKADIDHVKGLIKEYTEAYGPDFTTAYFDECLRRNLQKQLLELPLFLENAFTAYCEKRPAARKLDALRKVNVSHFTQASQGFLASAKVETADIWDKRTLVSLAKLATVVPDVLTQDMEVESEIANAEHEKIHQVADTQDMLYDHMYPTLRTAIDPEEKLNVAMEEFGGRYAKHKFCKQQQTATFTKIIGRKPVLPIDLLEILTMLGSASSPTTNTHQVDGQCQFWLALRILQLYHADFTAVGSRHAVQALERMIWRRVFLADDWNEILRMPEHGLVRDKAMEGTALYQLMKAGYTYANEHRDFTFRPISPAEASEISTGPVEKPSEWAERDALASIYGMEDNKRLQDSLLSEWKREASELRAGVAKALKLEDWEQLREAIQGVIQHEIGEQGEAMGLVARMLEDLSVEKREESATNGEEKAVV